MGQREMAPGVGDAQVSRAILLVSEPLAHAGGVSEAALSGRLAVVAGDLKVRGPGGKAGKGQLPYSQRETRRTAGLYHAQVIQFQRKGRSNCRNTEKGSIQQCKSISLTWAAYLVSSRI